MFFIANKGGKLNIGKIFLDNLPRNWKGVDWKNTINYKVRFVYNELEDEFKIIDYIRGEKYQNKVVVDYKRKIVSVPVSVIDSNKGLGKITGKHSKQYRYTLGENFKDNHRDLTILKQETRLIKMPKRTDKVRGYVYKCNICGWDNGWMPENMISRGNGCTCCSGSIVVEGINDIPTTSPWMIKFFPNGYEDAKLYSKRSDIKIFFKCPYCNKISTKKRSISNLYNTKTIPCKCNDNLSFIERYMHSLLEQLISSNQIDDYLSEHKYDWCKYYNPFTNKNTFGIYDFVIETKKIIIETDGGFHRIDNKMSGQTKEESQFKDSKKDELALQHGYKIIRITDIGDFRDNILKSQLANIFDLTNINWNKCLEDSCCNLTKKVCDYRKEHPNLSAASISRIFHLNADLIRKWLKTGNELGWCEYDGLLTKKVLCLETMKVYNSAKICVNDMNKQDNRITIVGIRNSLRTNGKVANYGYHYQYVENT